MGRQDWRRFVILDKRMLAVILRSVIRDRFGESEARAARETGGSRRTLGRLVKQRSNGVNAETAEWLKRVVPTERHEELDAILKSPLDRWATLLYKRWLDRELTGMHSDGVLNRVPFRHQVTALERQLAAEYPDLFGPFYDFTEERGWITRDSSGRRRKTHRRFELAIRRILEPLLLAQAAGFIEREWEELTKKERHSWLSHGLRQQRILLDRESDARRATRIVRKRAEQVRREHSESDRTQHKS